MALRENPADFFLDVIIGLKEHKSENENGNYTSVSILSQSLICFNEIPIMLSCRLYLRYCGVILNVLKLCLYVNLICRAYM